MLVAVVVGIIMAIVVGVSIIPTIVDAIRPEVVEETTEVVETGGTLASVLVYVFIATLLLGAVAWIAGEGTISFDWFHRWISGRPNPKFLNQSFSYKSQFLRKDRGNLDKLLGIKIEPVNGTEEEPLQLRGKTLVLSKEFAWYLDEKHSVYTMYKLVGLHHRHRNLNSVFIVGKDIHTGQPYLLRLPPGYLEEPLGDCIGWCIQAGKGDKLKEV